MNDHWRTVRRMAMAATVLLMIRIFVGILWEYRRYFPADFEASFLSGRRYTFVGSYPTAFYTHIISGPIVLAIAAFSMLTGGLASFRRYHRWAGRIGATIAIAVMLPSGLVMAGNAYSGPIAGTGFASLSIATAACILAAGWQAKSRKFVSHRRWAVRSFILLASPLLLRAIAGILVSFDLESNTSYRLNAWLSWSVPLAIHEIWACARIRNQRYKKKVVADLEVRHNESALDRITP